MTIHRYTLHIRYIYATHGLKKMRCGMYGDIVDSSKAMNTIDAEIQMHLLRYFRKNMTRINDLNDRRDKTHVLRLDRLPSPMNGSQVPGKIIQIKKGGGRHFEHFNQHRLCDPLNRAERLLAEPIGSVGCAVTQHLTAISLEWFLADEERDLFLVMLDLSESSH